MLLELTSLSGLVASVWFAVGVLVTGRLYDGYSHARQFCSELGATGSPVEKLSPLINNYPLGVMFGLFGWYLISGVHSLLIVISGWLIVIHGVSTVFAGYYPMDADPYIKEPTRQYELHTFAGMLMMLSLVLAIIVVLFSRVSFSFKVFSVTCVILFFVFLFKMIKEYQRHGNVGLYQRLSYGSQLLWLGVYSLIIS
jgi:hypothetical membrane protein